MGGFCRFLGVLSILGTAFAFLPLLGWYNWVHLPFAGSVLLFCALVWGLSGKEGTKEGAKAGAVMSIAAIAVGVFRLSMGGGVV